MHLSSQEVEKDDAKHLSNGTESSRLALSNEKFLLFALFCFWLFDKKAHQSSQVHGMEFQLSQTVENRCRVSPCGRAERERVPQEEGGQGEEHKTHCFAPFVKLFPSNFSMGGAQSTTKLSA